MTTERKKLNTQIYEEAADWFVDFREGDIDQDARRRFAHWLRASPEHLRAYLELAAIYNEGPNLDPAHCWDGDELNESNVIPGPGAAPLPSDPTLERSHKRLRHRLTERRGLFVGFAASLLVAMSLTTYAIYQRGLYTTGIGEQRSITLSDGTNVEVNARTKLRVAFTDHARTIELLKGQALFKVAKDPRRPFIVKSDGTDVRAVGTQFDVYRRANGITVTVVEGKVAVHSSSAPNAGTAAIEEGAPLQSRTANPKATERSDGAALQLLPSSAAKPHGIEAHPGEFLLAAGEQVIVTAQATIKPDKPNITAATAWTQRRLVFQGTSLADVAEEFNRYNQRRLVIQNAELGILQITGIFSSTDPTALIRFLQARPGITVTQGKEDIVITRAL